MIRKAIYKSFGILFILIGIWKIIWAASLWFGAYWLLKEIVNYVRQANLNKSSNQLVGHMYALGFLLSSLVASLAIHQMLSQSGRLGLRVN